LKQVNRQLHFFSNFVQELQLCGAHVFGLQILKALCQISKLDLRFFLNALDDGISAKPIWGGRTHSVLFVVWRQFDLWPKTQKQKQNDIPKFQDVIIQGTQQRAHSIPREMCRLTYRC